MEEYAYILDIPPQSHGRRENICYAVGDRDFKLFELVYKAGVVLQFEDRVYIGKEAEQRTAIDHVKRRIGYDELSPTAQSELEYAVSLAVKADEARFVKFFNTAGPINIKKHILEELPGLGKKSMMAIIEERRKEEFKDLADIAARVPSVKNPEKLIVARIMLEIMDADRKRYLFVER
jgi:putative nucleotide binding protein